MYVCGVCGVHSAGQFIPGHASSQELLFQLQYGRLLNAQSLLLRLLSTHTHTGRDAVSMTDSSEH